MSFPFSATSNRSHVQTVWNISNYEKCAALNIGRPPLIRLVDVNTALPAELEDWLITREGIHREGPRSIVRLANTYTSYYSVVAEQLLNLTNMPKRDWPKSDEKKTPTQHIYSIFPENNPLSKRSAALNRIEGTLDHIDATLPMELRVTPDMVFSSSMSEMHVFQVISIAITKVRSLH